MLNNYMKSNEYHAEIEKVVEESPEFKKWDEEYTAALDRIVPNNNLHESIETPATLLMVAARDLAYKKGFQDGVLLVADCISERSNADKGIDYNQAMACEDYKQAWNLKAAAFNRLMDLLMDHGVKSKEAKKVVEEYNDSVSLYTSISNKLGIPEAV